MAQDALKATATVNANWHTFAESQFSWERESLNFVRERLPAHVPWHAWSNLEFTDDQGNIREVDLLVFSPQGVFLVEIKNWRGVITGDASYWHNEFDGKRLTKDNPRRLANQKAKALKSLLGHQRAFAKIQCPFIEALVFLGDERARFEIPGSGAAGVCLRDTDERPGIMAALQRRECPGLDTRQGANLDKACLQAFNQALGQAGIRPSLHTRNVGDYRLLKTFEEGPGWQDWLGEHSSLLNNKRRIRFYLVRDLQGREQREVRERAARREFQLLESLNHPGILRAYDFKQHEIGPAVLLEYPEKALRLDHYLQQYGAKIGEPTRLHLIQRIAEAVHFAHRKQVVHRALSPHSILVVDPEDPLPGIRIMNWQTGSREGSTSAGHTISATSHMEVLVDEGAMAYLAPEVLEVIENGQEELDVFSLGALAYVIYSGSPPAESHSDLKHRLRRDGFLQISAVLNGASAALVELIQQSTQGSAALRLSSVEEFLAGINRIEDELTTPDNEFKGNPAEAPPKAILPGGYLIERRLGQGSSAVAYLVTLQNKPIILKLASHPQHNERLTGEHRVLKRLEGEQGLVQAHELVHIGDHVAIELEPTFADKERPIIETLAQRLGREGRLHIDLLERFSQDLLNILCTLEEKGIHHRDIKPDNIAVGQGEARRLHLTLFDFSLADTPPRNISAGTRRFLDPMLALKERGAYDTAAERYAAAVTFYQMAAGIGSFPVWGDGLTEATLLPATITEATINPELFESSMREGLTRFFTKAFQRHIDRRHHNAQEMRHHWNDCLAGLAPAPVDPQTDIEETAEALAQRLAGATFDTSIAELGLGTRAVIALDRSDIFKVRDLLLFPVFRLLRLPGVGSKTRREINDACKVLRDRLGNPAEPPATEAGSSRKGSGREVDPVTCTLEQATEALLLKIPANSRDAVRLFLALDDPSNPWPVHSTIARQKSLTTGRIGQIVVDLRKRWLDHPILTHVANQIAELLQGDRQGGVMTLDELAEVLIAQRGSQTAPARALPLARAIVRAAMEVETTYTDPRFIGRRGDNAVVFAVSEDLAKFAFKLGRKADELAQEDPLLNPQRALEQLRQVAGDSTSFATLQDNRLLRLAAATSSQAALSTRQELYPRGMAAVRALRLAQGAWLGTKFPTPEQIQERVSSRYPQAEPLPGRPHLDDLLKEADIPLTWDPVANAGHGAYKGPSSPNSFSAASSSLGRLATNLAAAPVRTCAPGLESALHLEDRLTRSRNQPNFLTLLVDPRLYAEGRDALANRFQAQVIDLEEHFLEAMRTVAAQFEVPWQTVLQADTKRNTQDWMNLLALAQQAIPVFEERLQSACRAAAPLGPRQTDRALLLVQPGLLSRYGHMNQLDKLAELAGKREGLPAVWLLLGGDQAMVDGQAVPLINTSQKIVVNEDWVRNKHRG